jgi:uncharacterized protein YwqG
LGDNHPDTLKILKNLEALYEEQGRYEGDKELDNKNINEMGIAKLELPKELERYRPQFEKSIKPALKINAQTGKTKIWESKFGGDPYLPPGYDYPKDIEGNPMRLLAQLNFEELPDIGMFPAQGILQFYITPYDESYGLDWDNPTNQDNFRIVYIPEVKKDETDEKKYEITNYSTVDESNNDFFPIPYECALSFEVDYQAVSIDDFQFEKIFGENAFAFAKKNFANERDADEFYHSFSYEGNIIGGYPLFAQGDPRENKYEDYVVLLLQIDSEVGYSNDNHIRWGDNGTASFFIRLEDLKKLDFSKVLYTCECG